MKPKVFELLAFLLRHPGQVFSRDQLLEQVWGYDYAGETRTVDVHVHWLRAVVEPDPQHPSLIETVRGHRLRPAAARRLGCRSPRQRTRLRIPRRSSATVPEAGMVRTQAMRMFPATPQRTAEKRSLEPTPMIADEITWVVETGIPKCDAPKMIVAAVVSAANPWTGSSFTTLWPIVLMIRQPPAAVPSEIALAASEDHPQRDGRFGEHAAGDERQGDDAHRLLGVVRAMAERHVRGRDDLEPPESIVDPFRVGAAGRH